MRHENGMHTIDTIMSKLATFRVHIAPLVDEWNFVEIEKIGRNRWIKITEEGQIAAEFLI